MYVSPDILSVLRICAHVSWGLDTIVAEMKPKSYYYVVKWFFYDLSWCKLKWGDEVKWQFNDVGRIELYQCMGEMKIESEIIFFQLFVAQSNVVMTKSIRNVSKAW